MSEVIIRKPIKVNWIAPNGRAYSDVINMSLKEYEKFVNDLLVLKKVNNP